MELNTNTVCGIANSTKNLPLLIQILIHALLTKYPTIYRLIEDDGSRKKTRKKEKQTMVPCLS